MDDDLINIIKTGGVGVLPTDTIYGLVGKALDEGVVHRIYELRVRTSNKPMITLISSLDDLKLFNVKPSPPDLKILQKYWPGKISIVLPCPEEKFFYLHRGTKTLAFRIPDDNNLRKFLSKTGPLVAPSANLEGKPPAEDIKGAKETFGCGVEFYLDYGKIISEPSTVIKVDDGKITVLRQGAVKI